MSDQSNAVRAKRHAELWQGCSRSLGRLVFAGLVFATVVLFKVLIPYADDLDHLALTRAKGAAARTELEAVESRVAQATQAADTVGQVSRTIGREPWREEQDALQSSIGRLVTDAEALRGIDPESLRTITRTTPVAIPPDDRQPDIRQLPPADRSGERATALHRATVSDRTVARLRAISLPALSEIHELEPSILREVLTARERGARPNRTALREHGVSEETASLLSTMPLDELNELRRAPLRLLQEKKIQDEQFVLDATGRLGISRDDIEQVRDGQSWNELVHARLRTAAQTKARESIARMTTRTRRTVIDPLQSVLHEEASGLTGVDDLERSVVDLDRTLTEWETDYAQRDDWYETVTGKETAFEALGEGLRAYRDRCRSVTEEILDRLGAEKVALTAERDLAEEQVTDIEAEMEGIDDALQSALPAWLRGLVTIDHAIQLFSFAVLALLLLGCWYAARTRHHFLVVREQMRADGVDDTESAMSTVWTLVYRGPLGTMVTIAAYGLVAGAAWYFILQGAEQAQRWRAHDPQDIIGLTATGPSLLAWFGPLVCIAAFTLTLLVLAKDFRDCRRTARTAHAQP
ncbi:MAG: hypothetical protein ACYTGG_05045 [Planctomycetota bacterium]|jgi:hypothetical protein